MHAVARHHLTLRLRQQLLEFGFIFRQRDPEARALWRCRHPLLDLYVAVYTDSTTDLDTLFRCRNSYLSVYWSSSSTFRTLENNRNEECLHYLTKYILLGEYNEEAESS